MKFETTIEVDGVDVAWRDGDTPASSLARAIREFESDPQQRAEDISVIRTVETA